MDVQGLLLSNLPDRKREKQEAVGQTEKMDDIFTGEAYMKDERAKYIELFRTWKKSDLHSHAGRGGNKKFMEEAYGVKIDNPPERFESLQHMQEWYVANIRDISPDKTESAIKRWEAAFKQANEDNIAVLVLSFGNDENAVVGGMRPFVDLLSEMAKKYAPNTLFLPELTYFRGCDVDKAVEELDELLAFDFFKSIDVCGDEFAAPVEKLVPLYRKAEANGLKLKAHVGEFGSADDVMRAVETLHLSEVHHGIAVADSQMIMKWLVDNKIRLNVCPTSNVMLGRTLSYEAHPIKKLFHAGVPVTINTDDMLIFNQSVSEEYANLLCAGTLTLEELEQIRLTGLGE